MASLTQADARKKKCLRMPKFVRRILHFYSCPIVKFTNHMVGVTERSNENAPCADMVHHVLAHLLVCAVIQVQIGYVLLSIGSVYVHVAVVVSDGNITPSAQCENQQLARSMAGLLDAYVYENRRHSHTHLARRILVTMVTMWTA
jgi:hypothetical protein